jgi:hypothetical protein
MAGKLRYGDGRHWNQSFSKRERHQALADMLERRVLLAAATLDDSFADGGVRSTNDLDAWTSVLSLSGGWVFAAGATPRLDATAGSNIVVSKFMNAGDPDPGFGGGDGNIEVDFGFLDSFAMLRRLPGGKIVLVATTHADLDPADGNLAVARFFENGLADESFGPGGKRV